MDLRPLDAWAITLDQVNTRRRLGAISRYSPSKPTVFSADRTADYTMVESVAIVLQLLDEHKRFLKMVGETCELGLGKDANWEQEQRNPFIFTSIIAFWVMLTLFNSLGFV